MNIKKIVITIVAAITLVLGFLLYKQIFFVISLRTSKTAVS